MQTLALLLVAAATTGDGLAKPGVGGLKLFRHHAVVEGEAPPGGPIAPPGGAGAGAGMAGQPGRRFPNVRSQIIFLDPKDMKISWQTAAGPGGERAYTPGLTVPDRYNFMQGYIYRLRVSDIQGRAGVVLYPTIEVAPSTPATDAYLTHNAIPVQFTAEDFDQVVDGGNFVTKVIYLPDPKYQELAVPGGPETLISTRLEPGVDPIIEADKRGTILLIVRLGGINLEINGGTTTVVAPATVESVPVDGAPLVVPGASPLVPATAVPPVVAPVPAAAPAGPAPAPGLVPAPPATNPVPTAPVPGPAVVPGAVSLPAPPIEPAPPIPSIEPPQPIPAAPGN